MIRTLLRRLTTDTDALRRENERAIGARDDALKVAAAFKGRNDQLLTENARLRALAGNTEATHGERIALDVVRSDPGKLPGDYALPYFRAEREAELAAWLRDNPPGEPPARLTSRTDDAPWFVVQYTSKHLQNLHKKGLVRREKAGQTYRYWPSDG